MMVGFTTHAAPDKNNEPPDDAAIAAFKQEFLLHLEKFYAARESNFDPAGWRIKHIRIRDRNAHHRLPSIAVILEHIASPERTLVIPTTHISVYPPKKTRVELHTWIAEQCAEAGISPNYTPHREGLSNEILKGIRDGDPAALEYFFTHNQKRWSDYAQRALRFHSKRDPHLAEDVVSMAVVDFLGKGRKAVHPQQWVGRAITFEAGHLANAQCTAQAGNLHPLAVPTTSLRNDVEKPGYKASDRIVFSDNFLSVLEKARSSFKLDSVSYQILSIMIEEYQKTQEDPKRHTHLQQTEIADRIQSPKHEQRTVSHQAINLQLQRNIPRALIEAAHALAETNIDEEHEAFTQIAEALEHLQESRKRSR